ncbi:exodeoxyribonuclease VII large subunit [Sulfurimonas sp. HSL-1716]|uniref:exodeoxyribonuclease VII large subunit n=1 Tax=Hydrocurvibacter sulfurireducens TaxID=3131937 RepID=UPI0031F9AAD5
MNTLSVSSLNEQIKTLLESSFVRVFVEGELSRITHHNSGHIYFTLKDSTSAIKCVMFKGNAAKLRFNLEEGLKVILDGAVTVYKPRGEYQINCFMIEPSGQGALALAYEQLKQKLSQKGYFDPEIKKQLPKFPRRIALITSATGAALQDMLRVAAQRYRLLEIDIYDVLVQGNSSAQSIVDALHVSDKKDYDVIVLARGGGSIEDLWSFNEEIVADAIFEARTPIVSAVGHEIDYLISDFTADLRAPTPSAAMQMILPDTNELYQYLDSLSQSYNNTVDSKIYNFSQALFHIKKLYEQNSIEQQIRQKKVEVTQLKERFDQTILFNLQNLKKEIESVDVRLSYQIQTLFSQKQNRLDALRENLISSNPKNKVLSGFVQISKKSKVISLEDLHINDSFDLMNERLKITSKVIEIKEHNR